MKKCLIVFLLTAPIFAGTATLKGKINLSGATFEQGTFIYVKKGADREKDLTKIAVDHRGTFSVQVEAPHAYELAFAHPGFEPIEFFVELAENETLDLHATLGLYEAPPKGQWAIVFEHDGWDLANKRPLEKAENGQYFIDIETDLDKVRYQIVGRRSFNGQDPAVEVDAWGDYISEKQVQGGKVRITFDPSRFATRPMGSNTSAWMESKQGGETAVAVYNWVNLLKVNRAMMLPRGPQTADKEEIDELLTRIRHIVNAISDEQERMIFSQSISRFTRKLSDEFNHAPTLRAKLEKEPDFITELDFNVYLSLKPTRHVADGTQDSKLSAKELESWARIYLESDRIPKAAKARAAYTLGQSIQTDHPEGFRYWMTYLVEEHPDSPLARAAKTSLKQAEMNGMLAPEIELKDASGKLVKLSDYRGKYVLVDFWATWCGPCIAEIPNLVKAYGEVDKNRIEFLSVCLDKSGAPLKKWSKKHKTSWPQLGTSGDFRAAITQDYAIDSIPALFLIGPDGKIIGRNLPGLRGENIAGTLAGYYTPVN